jgi:hypothetical protein
VAQLALRAIGLLGDGLQDLVMIGCRRLAKQQPQQEDEIQAGQYAQADKDPENVQVFRRLQDALDAPTTPGLSGVSVSPRVR